MIPRSRSAAQDSLYCMACKHAIAAIWVHLNVILFGLALTLPLLLLLLLLAPTTYGDYRNHLCY